MQRIGGEAMRLRSTKVYLTPDLTLLQILKERSSKITPEYSYNTKAVRYRNKANGRFVSSKELRGAIDKAIDKSGKEIGKLSQELKEGRMSLADWQTAMGQEIKNSHLASVAAAKGGWHQMTAADYGRAGGRIRGQLWYLNRFAQQIESGKQRLDGSFLHRSKMYIEAARETYHIQLREEMKKAGMTKEKNILGVADHCDDCLGETAKGWVDIGELTLIGQRQCLKNCKCRIEYK